MRQSACLRTGRLTEEGASMPTQSILTWVVVATSRLLPSQSQPLAVLVAAAIRCPRPGMTEDQVDALFEEVCGDVDDVEVHHDDSDRLRESHRTRVDDQSDGDPLPIGRPAGR